MKRKVSRHFDYLNSSLAPHVPMGFTLKHCLGNVKLDPSFNWKAVNDSHIFHVHSLGFLYVKREVLPRNSLFFFTVARK